MKTTKAKAKPEKGQVRTVYMWYVVEWMFSSPPPGADRLTILYMPPMFVQL